MPSLARATFVLLLALAGCATEPTARPAATSPELRALAGITEFDLSGRIAVRQGETGHYGNLRWLHNIYIDNVSLLSPLGQVVTQVTRDRDGFELTNSNQQRFRAPDAESLTQQVLGYTIPLAGLERWVLGLPASGSEAIEEHAADNRLVALTQDGWRIVYLDYRPVSGYLLPSRITLQRDDLVIKLAIDDWRVGAAR